MRFSLEYKDYKTIGEENINYEFLDINTYSTEQLYGNQSISSAIFLLDQDINRKEFYERLENIIINFNRLKSEEKLKLKQWIINVNSNDDEFKNNIEKIFNLDKKGVLEMTSNISKGLEKFKQEAIKAITTDIFEIQKIEDIERYFPQIL